MDKKNLIKGLKTAVKENPRSYCKAMISFIDKNKGLKRISKKFNDCSNGSGGLTALLFTMDKKPFKILNFAGEHIVLVDSELDKKYGCDKSWTDIWEDK